MSGLAQASLDDRRRCIDADAERFEHIRAAAAARHRSIAVLGDLHAARRQTIAAAEEMLNVPERSPAGPARIEHLADRRVSGTACARIVRAKPTISAGRSPFITSADSNAASGAGAARPSMTSRHRRRGLIVGEILVAHELFEQLR